ALLVLVAFSPAFQAGFIWDDDGYIQDNLNLRTLAGLRRIWLEKPQRVQYYPLTLSSFWLEYHLWRTAPAGYHVDNVLLHAASAILLWRVLKRLAIPGAWVAAAIWAIHPVNVESVAWATERKNVLSAVFYLLATLAWLQLLHSSRKKTWYALALVAFIAA